MNVFVTVGTTNFNSLIKSIDTFSKSNDFFSFTYQVSDGNYKPNHGSFFSFTESINEYYLDADLIVTHAGAGSIYKLLEMNKKIIIVPNLERVDKHQLDIARFMEENRYGLVCYDLNYIDKVILSSLHFEPTAYIKDEFFKAQEIAELILK